MFRSYLALQSGLPKLTTLSLRIPKEFNLAECGMMYLLYPRLDCGTVGPAALPVGEYSSSLGIGDRRNEAPQPMSEMSVPERYFGGTS